MQGQSIAFNYNKTKELKNDRDGVQLMTKDLHLVHITGNKRNMWAETERES